MTDFLIEQAVFALRIETQGHPPITTWGRSDGFRDDWLPLAEAIMHGFGAPPVGIACPLAVFAQPFGRDHVAVVQATDRPHAARVRYSEPRGSTPQEPQPPTSDPNIIAYHFLILPRQAYERYLGDPFHLAKQLPAAWQQRGPLPAHSWPSQPLPERTVEEVQRVLKRTKVHWGEKAEDQAETTKAGEKDAPAAAALTVENAESPALLGGAQVLVDGGRLVFRRPAPDLDLVQGLWTLLPASTRCRLWPASFAFGNDLVFDVVVLPVDEPGGLRPPLANHEPGGLRPPLADREPGGLRPPLADREPGGLRPPLADGYTTEEQAMDYPEGRYELSLQFAAERGDQAEVTALLNRPSAQETTRMGVILLGFMIVLVLGFGVFFKAPRPLDSEHLRAATVASTVAAMATDANPWSRLATLQMGRKIFNKQAGD